MLIKSTPPDGAPVQRARQLLERGEIPSADLIDPTVARSWQRSSQAGLLPFGRVATDAHLDRPGLIRSIERRADLLTRARPVMEYLHAQTRGSGSIVILADDRAVLLESLGDGDFSGRAERVALMPGASWSEPHRGTNAIGTALAEAAPVTVHGGEHFLEHHGFLTCAAAPIAGPDGRLLGVLDISGHRRGRHPHTFGLVRVGAHMVENRLFEAAHSGDIRLRLHPQADGIGSVAEGLVAIAPDGRILGANRAALALLALDVDDIGTASIESRLHLRNRDLLNAGMRSDGLALAAERSGGGRLFIKVEGRFRPPSAVPAAPSAAPADDALARLDSGDAVMAAAISRARKVVGKPIALLLQGESGVGKEVFAKALHASGPRRHKPFVAVNCAALPETLIEAELFGYAPGAFTGARRDGAPGRIREAHGGTLFLDEIGDMPLALQARLLRVLQDRQVVPLGGGKPALVDFALVSATHRSLKEIVEAGAFRQDLYFRLNGLSLTLPPLRQRSDFRSLLDRMLAEHADGRAVSLTLELERAMATFDWPGNLRQLSSVLATACALLDPSEHLIDWHHLPDDIALDLREPRRPDKASRAGTLRERSDRDIAAAVAAAGGNVSEAARRLGISRNTLYRRLPQAKRG